MKKVGFLVMCCLITTITIAQVEVIELPKTIQIGCIKNGFNKDASLDIYVPNGTSDTVALLTYRKFYNTSGLNNTATLSFPGDVKTINSLYDAFMGVFKSKDKEYTVVVKLSDGEIMIMKSIMGTVVFGNTFYTRGLTKNQINKLFGKNEAREIAEEQQY